MSSKSRHNRQFPHPYNHYQHHNHHHLHHVRDTDHYSPSLPLRQQPHGGHIWDTDAQYYYHDEPRWHDDNYQYNNNNGYDHQEYYEEHEEDRISNIPRQVWSADHGEYQHTVHDLPPYGQNNSYYNICVKSKQYFDVRKCKKYKCNIIHSNVKNSKTSNIQSNVSRVSTSDIQSSIDNISKPDIQSNENTISTSSIQCKVQPIRTTTAQSKADTISSSTIQSNVEPNRTSTIQSKLNAGTISDFQSNSDTISKSNIHWDVDTVGKSNTQSKVKTTSNHSTCNTSHVHSTNSVSLQTPLPQNRVNCLMCNAEIGKRNVMEHLHFGSVKCLDCPFKAETCKVFNDRYEYRNGCSIHKFEWNFFNVKEMSITKCKLKSFLNKYLSVTSALKYYQPYDKAYKVYQKMQDDIAKELSVSSTNDTDSSDYFSDISNESFNMEQYQNKNNVSNPASKLLTTKTKFPIKIKQSLIKFEKFSGPFVISEEQDCYNMSVLSLKKRLISENNKLKSKQVPSLQVCDAEKKMMCTKISNKTVNDKNISASLRDNAKENKRSIRKVINRLHTRLPSHVKENYVITNILRDYCPNCSTDLNSALMRFYLDIGVITVKCEACSLHVCFPKETLLVL